MISFDVSTLIYRPLTQVFTFVTVPENDFQWQYGTLTSIQISQGIMRIGALFHAVSHVMGRRIETTYEVTTFEPNKKYGFKSISGSMESHTLYTFEMAESATKINLSVKTNPGDLFQPNNAIVVKRFKKQHKENLAILKSVLEAHRSI